MSASRTTAISSDAAQDRPILCVTIDCERDKGPHWRVQRPAAFRGIHEGIGARLAPLFRQYGVKPTYLLSPEVMRDDAAAARMAQLARGADLGTHLHAEYVGPDLDEDAESSTFQASLAPAIERAKVEALTSLFVHTFGTRPRSFRAGRFGIGGASLEILADLGYTVDSSVTPFIDWSGAGPGAPDFRQAPFIPYHPDPHAPATTGQGPGWEIPVTIRPRLAHRLPVMSRFFARRLRPRWLRPTWGSAPALIDLARDVWKEAELAPPARIGSGRAAPPIWNVMFHNVEVVAGASPYSASESRAQAIIGRLAQLLGFARAAGARSVGLADVPELLS